MQNASRCSCERQGSGGMQNASRSRDFIAWRRVARMCLGGMNSSGPHFQQGSKTAGTIAGPRFLGGGYLVFAVAASSAGNSYSAWIRSEANDVVAGGHVQDHWNTSYSVFARVPTAGRYWLLLQLDWEACDGVREDGLRDDSVLGFDVGTPQGILPGHSQAAQEWTKAGRLVICIPVVVFQPKRCQTRVSAETEISTRVTSSDRFCHAGLVSTFVHADSSGMLWPPQPCSAHLANPS